MHALPVLAAVEQQMAGEPFVVIGVHSPKLPSEADAEMVRAAVRRHGISHPVVVDSGHRVWADYAVKAWPTLVLIDPTGVIAATTSGEPDVEPLAAAIAAVLDRHRDDASTAPLPLAPEAPAAGALSFPGGIAVGREGVYVVDSGHHQVVECDLDGNERRRFGGFTWPHGCALDGRGGLLVADTGAHRVVRLDLDTGVVTPLAGTGRRGRPSGGGPALVTDLRSPWDVVVDGDDALVAMAGAHQLWRIAGGRADVYAGTGWESRHDGPLHEAVFAQPSGLAWGADGALYVADSESSSLRRVTEGRVATVADSFQHPVGVAAGFDGSILVADTLNHRVCDVDPADGAVRAVFGNGEPLDAYLTQLEGRPPVPVDARHAAAFLQPEAVAVLGDEILVVDTGNHRVVAVDPASGATRVWLHATP
jgi:sugar lactone lactonase YvrE